MNQKDADLYNMQTLLNTVKGLSARKMVVVSPYDRATLESISAAHNEDIIMPILIGEEKRIKRSAEQYNIPVNNMEIICSDEENIIERASSLLLEGKAHFIMKGMVRTGYFFHVLLDPRFKIRTERILSHVGMFEITEKKRIFLMSDAAINILPNFTRKIHIVANAVDAAHKLGIGHVKVAMLAALERVKLPAMPATLDAFLMKKFAETGYFERCEIDGPFAFDNALDPEKARTKGIGGDVAGNANIIIVPNIETGNVLYKSITCIQRQDAAGVVLGGTCPIVLTSRSDDFKTKLNSIKFARLLIL